MLINALLSKKLARIVEYIGWLGLTMKFNKLFYKITKKVS